MPAPSPKPKKVEDLKASIMRPALTSHFQCYFNPPGEVRSILNSKVGAGVATKKYDGNEEFFSLSCSEASLPGSTFATAEINNDYSGVTQRYPYRRLYDDRADFTFYVDHDYGIITFFEAWMQHIADEQVTSTQRPGWETPNYFYRMNYPKGTGGNRGDGYVSEIYLHKFEKDYEGRYLIYRFLEAYPISISSMPVSYENSQILKCTVSFSYTRYIISSTKNVNPNPPKSNPNSNQKPAVTPSPNIGTLNPRNNVSSDIRVKGLADSFGAPSQDTINRFAPRTTNYGSRQPGGGA
jgi:hypothetical protein